MTSQARRWLPGRQIVLLTDGGLIAVRLGLRYRQPVTFVSRLHLNIRLFEPPVAKPRGKRGPAARLSPRQPTLHALLDDPQTVWTRQTVTWYGGKRRQVEWVSGTALWHTPSQHVPLPIRWVLVRDPAGKFKATAFCCTDMSVTAEQILAWYVLRWNVEVTFQECRAHLGFETQRQWNALAIARTTPIILGLYSLVTLLAQHLTQNASLPVRSAAWYPKPEATFSDALAFVRRYLWHHSKFSNPLPNTRLLEFPPPVLDILIDTLAYIA
jgi:hypothetical protein